MTTPASVAVGRTGLARISAGAGANPAASVSNPSASRVSFFDDFLGDVLADQWALVEGTDGATSDAAILAGGIGGVVRITTGDAGTGLAADLIGLVQALQWQASNGALSAEVRLKMSAVAACYLFFGFTDSVSLEAPIESAGSANTLTSNASDAVGFMFDTRMAADNFWLVGVKGDVDATAQDSLIAPVATQYVTLRVVVDSSGYATFYINSRPVGSQMVNAITAATDLTPCLYAGKLSGASSITVDADYVSVGMDRAANGGTV